MTRPVFGMEIEYGVAVLGSGPMSEGHPMAWSNAVVRGYRELTAQGTGWDYDTEAPLQDARGWSVDRAESHPDLLTDDDTMTNLVVANGARFYVDHAHPEYSGPEVTSPRQAVVFDQAGDRIALAGAARASRRLGQPVRLWRNNTDGKGASYGTHENYLVARSVPFGQLVRGFTGFLATRSVVTGAGRVGVGQQSEQPGFQLSQRADFFEAEVGLETTIRRPIINTRDEPHADQGRYRRLHVITGDANRSDYSNWLKVGAAALVLAALEAGFVNDSGFPNNPVATMRQTSHDLTLAQPIELADGRQLTAIQVQREYADACGRFLDAGGDELGESRPEFVEVLAAWQDTLDLLASDFTRLADRLDWVAKLSLLNSFRQRDNLSWNDPKLALIDLQYAELDPQRSLYARLVAAGRLRRLVSDAEIEDSITCPPPDTRAYFRGRVMDKFGEHVAAASWDSLVLDVPGRQALLRVPLNEPLRGTKALVGELIEASDTINDLVTGLAL